MLLLPGAVTSSVGQFSRCALTPPARPHPLHLPPSVGAGDSLTAHVDDAERSLQQPLVSLSLGVPAIFLIGTYSKQDPPTALLLRSGDAVVLGGAARRCYHGLPRVLVGGEGGGGGCGGAAEFAALGVEEGEEGEAAFLPFARHMQRCRINISIRDTR